MKLTKSKLKEIIREELQKINEADLEKTAIPSDLKRFMNRFIDKLKSKNLNKIKQVAVLYNVVKALGISTSELQMYIQKVKRGL
jgi:hypothetical protein